MVTLVFAEVRGVHMPAKVAEKMCFAQSVLAAGALDE
jgi:hypothetical protein